jgi:RNA recognition motif-containing protein
MRLFVNNLAWKTTDDDLRNHFVQAGAVTDAKIVTDKATGRSRGFGFVTMPDSVALVAIKTLNESSLLGRNIYVAEAHERDKRENESRY